MTLGYDVWDDAGAMASRETTLTVGGILPMAGVGADPTLTPEFPGISDRTTVADWDPSFPVDLKRITPARRGLLDAVQGRAEGVRLLHDRRSALWSSRFGRMTSLRILPPPGDYQVLSAR